jgi:hypothetical protein
LATVGFPIPTNLQKRLVIFLLKRSLGKILKDELNLNQLEVSMGTQGMLTLRDLNLQMNALNPYLLQTPWIALQGHIDVVNFTIPWMDLLNTNCQIQIDGIHVKLGLEDPSGSENCTCRVIFSRHLVQREMKLDSLSRALNLM